MARLTVYFNVDEGLFGIHIKRNHQVTTWKQLNYDERNRIIEYLEKALIVCKSNKFDKK